jgi:hypothetical protein
MADGTEVTDGVEPSPLLRRDPPAVGDVRLTGRLGSHDAGMVYAGRLDDEDVAVVMLTDGAEADSYARARFRDATATLENDRPGVVAGEDDEELAPWVAVTVSSWSDGLQVSHALLTAVTLADQPPVGTVHGPAFRPHWWERSGVGRWRLWPMPWPSRLSAAGRWTFVASFGVACAIAALALFIVIQVFQNTVPPPPGPGPGPGPLPPPTQPTPTSPSPTSPHGPSPTLGPSTGQPYPPIV